MLPSLLSPVVASLSPGRLGDASYKAWSAAQIYVTETVLTLLTICELHR